MIKPLLFAVSTLGLIACGAQTETQSDDGQDDSLLQQPDNPQDGSQKPNTGNNGDQNSNPGDDSGNDSDNSNDDSNQQEDDPHNGIITDTVSLAPEMMKKAAFYFSDSLPSLGELENMEEADYQQQVDELLNGKGFSNRLVAIFEDRLMSDKYIAANDRDGAIDLFNNRDYPNRKWYDDDFEDQNTI